MAKLCSILRNSMLNVEEQGGGAPGNKQKGVVRNCGMGRYHHGTLRCSRVAIPDFLSLYNVPPKEKIENTVKRLVQVIHV